jgi:hypothetical protein
VPGAESLALARSVTAALLLAHPLAVSAALAEAHPLALSARCVALALAQ